MALARAISATTAAKGVQCALGLGLTLGLARWLGAEAYGTYAGAMAAAQLGAVVAATGLPQLAARDGAAHAARGEHRARAALARHLVRHAARVTGLAIMVGAAAWGLVPGLGPGMALATATVGAALVALRLLGQWRIGQGRPVAGELADGAGRRGAFALCALTAAALVAPSAGAALTAHAVGALLALAVAAGAWRLPEPSGTRATLPTRDRLGFWAVGVMNVAMANVDVLMLSALAPPGAAGPYAVAARLAELPALVLLAANAALAPRVAHAEALGRRRDLARPACWTARTVTALALAGVAGAALAGDAVLGLAGPGFVAAWPALVILLAAQTVNAGCGAAALLLDTAGEAHRTAAGVAAGAGVNLALNAALIPAYGAVGAAVATGAGLASWNLVLAWQTRRHLGLDPTPLGRAPA